MGFIILRLSWDCLRMIRANNICQHLQFIVITISLFYDYIVGLLHQHFSPN
jgi:hypothetical protein